MRGKQGRAAGLRGAAQRTAGASSIRAVASARQTRRSNDATDAPDARAGAQRRLIFGRPYKSLRVVDQRHQQRHAVGNHDARGAPRLPPGGAHLRGRAPRSGHPYAERRRSRPLAAAHPLEVARLEQAVEHAESRFDVTPRSAHHDRGDALCLETKEGMPLPWGKERWRRWELNPRPRSR
jgi:hypothetical protein